MSEEEEKRNTCVRVCVRASPQAAALASGVMDKLGRPGHYTLFAPTNEAFNRLSPGHLQRMMGDKNVIAGTLRAR